MKKLATSFLFLMLVFLGYSQDIRIASCTSKSTLIEGKNAGKIVLHLPQSITADEVKENAVYYERTFTVTFDEKSHDATFQMLVNDANARRVILRFLAASQIQSVSVEGKTYSASDFYENFLK